MPDSSARQGVLRHFVYRQLGHANPNITLTIYAHLFGQADRATAARDALEASYAVLTTAGKV
jgi:hypothetical protein